MDAVHLCPVSGQEISGKKVLRPVKFFISDPWFLLRLVNLSVWILRMASVEKLAHNLQLSPGLWLADCQRAAKTCRIQAFLYQGRPCHLSCMGWFATMCVCVCVQRALWCLKLSCCCSRKSENRNIVELMDVKVQEADLAHPINFNILKEYVIHVMRGMITPKAEDLPSCKDHRVRHLSVL